MLFRRIVLFALLIGGLSGLLLSAVQRWQVIPIIDMAESHEQARGMQEAVALHEAGAAHSHAGQGQGDHEHEAGAWAPAEGFERIFFTVLSNILTASGYALLMLAAMAAALKRGATHGNGATRVDWRRGLLWGAAGYVVFFAAPSLGLPPEIPGAEAASVDARQLWWLLTAASTAAGLAVIAFGKSPWRWAGLALLVIPHISGAPHLATSQFADYSASAAAELSALAAQFVLATALSNALFWLALGGLSGWAARRYVTQALAESESDGLRANYDA